jgi:DMSO/TMAO reductase YedYZ molybdopterin-dependent catalytic subunit
MEPSGRRTLRYAACGLAAAAAGMGVGHFVAAFVNLGSSPVLAVGSTVVDLTPTPVKEWAVGTLGTADKPVLITAVAVVTALVAAAIGVASRTRPPLANALLLVLAGLAGLAALLRPAALLRDAFPSLVAAAVGVGVLTVVRRWAQDVDRAAGLSARPAPTRPESPLDHTAYAPGAPGGAARRTFLLGAGGATVGAVALGGLGQRFGSTPTVPADVTLPAPASPLPPLPAGLERTVKGLSPFRTPNRDFYRIDTALVVPRVDLDKWKLVVDGMVDRPVELTFDDLLRLEVLEKDVTLNCVSNEVGGPYISSTRWLGVRIRDVLERARVQGGADQVLSESVDGMTISTPVEALTDDREALLAFGMDGQPLPTQHGFPVRMVTPGLYGYVGATKWLTRLTATTYARQEAYWTERGWAERGPVKTQSRIDTPAAGGTYDAGRVVVAGVAWAQAGNGISKVEVRVDDGPWQQATLGPDGGTVYWRQWSWAWDAPSGRHRITVRATNGNGEVQPATVEDPFPSGASGYHQIEVTIS